MLTKKNDFVEIEYTAYANNMVFDTTLEEEAKKANLDSKNFKFKPLTICISRGMVINGFDEQLENKEINKQYTIEISPEKAFGQRKAELIKTFSIEDFQQQPSAGMLVNVNGLLAKVITIQNNRVLLDFNNPLSGKTIKYCFKINNILTDNKEKILGLANNLDLKIESLVIQDNQAQIKIKKEEQSFKEEEQSQRNVSFKEKIKALKSIIKELLNIDCSIE